MNRRLLPYKGCSLQHGRVKLGRYSCKQSIPRPTPPGSALMWAPSPSPSPSPAPQGADRPLPRSGHSSCCIRERVFVFGGASGDGVLLNDVWMYDQDSCQWSHINTFGTVPSPRTGARCCAARAVRVGAAAALLLVLLLLRRRRRHVT